jgi:para-aminobenzoate synthetase component 1
MHQKIQFSAETLVNALLDLSREEKICLLDSCNVPYLGSHFLIAGIAPVETFEISGEDSSQTLQFLDEKLSAPDLFSIFTLSYEFGLKLENIEPRAKSAANFNEPDVFLAQFDCLIVHDYRERESFLIGNEKRFDEIIKKLENAAPEKPFKDFHLKNKIRARSNFSKNEYLETIEKIKEFIRRGDTYQTNLTQQISAELPEELSPQKIFFNLRQKFPAPFSAFIQRKDSVVISASPERFFKIDAGFIETSPIKGTRPRGETSKEDSFLRKELLESAKDRAENVMIVDLLRNDLGKICKFGTVEVEKLCELETHPTLFHLVSTIKGILRENTRFSDVLKAVFPCGSITGAPKIRTMQIIDELETAPRGLSMGAIGLAAQSSMIKTQNSTHKIHDSNFKTTPIHSQTIHYPLSTINYLDLSVAIRTMVVRERTAIFNVGGGIVIDSVDENEYEETLVKAKALLESIGAEL